MKRFILFALLIFSLAFTFCKKDKKTNVTDTPEQTASTPVNYPDYLQLKTGNYWIYQRFEIDANLNEKALNEIDSCYIIGDTLIRNRKFFKMHRYDFLFSKNEVLYMADSLHYVIGQTGDVIFSSEDFTTVFNEYYGINNTGTSQDTMYKMTKKMDDKDLSTPTPAGVFVTSNMKTTITAYPGYAPSPGYVTRWMNSKYSKNVGLILETEPLFLGSLLTHERRLIRYHLN